MRKFETSSGPEQPFLARIENLLNLKVVDHSGRGPPLDFWILEEKGVVLAIRLLKAGIGACIAWTPLIVFTVLCVSVEGSTDTNWERAIRPHYRAGIPKNGDLFVSLQCYVVSRRVDLHDSHEATVVAEIAIAAVCGTRLQLCNVKSLPAWPHHHLVARVVLTNRGRTVFNLPNLRIVGTIGAGNRPDIGLAVPCSLAFAPDACDLGSVW